MAETTTLKLRIPSERYIALIQLAHANDRSINGQVNHLILDALNEYIDVVKGNGRGQDGVENEKKKKKASK